MGEHCRNPQKLVGYQLNDSLILVVLISWCSSRLLEKVETIGINPEDLEDGEDNRGQSCGVLLLCFPVLSTIVRIVSSGHSGQCFLIAKRVIFLPFSSFPLLHNQLADRTLHLSQSNEKIFITSNGDVISFTVSPEYREVLLPKLWKDSSQFSLKVLEVSDKFLRDKEPSNFWVLVTFNTGGFVGGHLALSCSELISRKYFCVEELFRMMKL